MLKKKVFNFLRGTIVAKKRFKKRRHINTDELFNRRNKIRFSIIEQQLYTAFWPDMKKMNEYINQLLIGLEKEPFVEV